MSEARWNRTSAYLGEVFGREDPHLRQLILDAREAGLPEISVSAEVGRLLSLLVSTTGATRALELGTLGGYSSTWIARALAPGGKLTTIELSPKHAAFAREHLERGGLSARVEVVEGAALAVLEPLLVRLAPLDFVFIDAVKTEYPDYLRLLAGAIAPGGLLVADNVLGAGSWWIDDAPGRPDRDAMDRFNRTLAQDERFEVAAVPIREGVLIARRR